MFAPISDRKGEQGATYGLRHSEKTKQALSKIKKGIPLDQLGKKVSIEGEIYPSIASASRETKRARKYIRDRVNSKDFSDWFF